MNCQQNGIESANCGRECRDNHFKVVGELIEDYRKSKKRVKNPMVVMFEQTKEYRIMAKSELTPGLWVEKPYVTFGELKQIEKMVRTNRRKDSLGG